MQRQTNPLGDLRLSCSECAAKRAVQPSPRRFALLVGPCQSVAPWVSTVDEQLAPPRHASGGPPTGRVEMMPPIHGYTHWPVQPGWLTTRRMAWPADEPEEQDMQGDLERPSRDSAGDDTPESSRLNRNASHGLGRGGRESGRLSAHPVSTGPINVRIESHIMFILSHISFPVLASLSPLRIGSLPFVSLLPGLLKGGCVSLSC